MTISRHLRRIISRRDSLSFIVKRFYYSGEAAGTLNCRTSTSTGLYGYDVLKSPSGFRKFAQDAIEKSDELIERIRQTPPSMETIQLFDELSDTICTVVDSAELCRNTHPDSAFIEESSQASMKIYEYMYKLNTNVILYNAISNVEKTNCLTTDEARRAAHSHRIEFERGGVHLPNEKLERVQQLSLQNTHLGREFVSNMLRDPGHFDIFPMSKAPKFIQQMSKPILRTNDGSIKFLSKADTTVKASECGARVITETDNLFSILKWAKDGEVRKKAYIAGYSVPKRNLQVIDDLIASRHEFAKVLGYKSYADFNLAPTMAASPEVVKNFLHEFSESIRDKADEELMMLENFGKQIEGARFKGVNAWDELYFTNLMKGESIGLDHRVVASYFPLNQCIEGLKIITQSLFGAALKEVPISCGEGWHPTVQKFTLHSSTEGDLGHLYLDLYSRKGKFPGCAHFSVRGGRRLSETKYQLPVVALVCNFSSSFASCPVLNHSEVETLFHEFGHALHSLLTRTDYQHFSGTRTALDFVEIPSNLFEYYAWDHRVLQSFAKHYSTGEVIPLELIKLMQRAKDMFAAMDLQKQVLYAMIDQTFFGDQPLLVKDTTSVIAHLKEKYASWKHVEGTHSHTRFNHLVTYGAGYYSYLYARCIAATIWNAVCKPDPLAREAGDVIRMCLLQYGGAKDPASIIKHCVNVDALITCKTGGVKPSFTCLFKELDITL